MNRHTLTLCLLLGLSLVANLALSARSARHQCKPANGAALSKAGGAEPAAQVAALRMELETERKKIASLEREAEVLRKAIPGAPAAAAAPKPGLDRAALRERIRNLLRMEEDGQDAIGDPEAIAEVMKEFMEYTVVFLAPSRNPSKYREFMVTAFEVGLEDDGAPLSPEQLETLASTGDELVAALGSVTSDGPGKRQLGEIEAQKAWTRKALDLLTPDQRAKYVEGGRETLDVSTFSSTTRWVQKATLIKQVSDDWSNLLGLEGPTTSMVAPAAQQFAAALQQINAEFARQGFQLFDMTEQGQKDPYHSVQVIEYRERVLKAQVEAISTLQGALSAAQQEKLSKATLWDYCPAEHLQTFTAPFEPER